MTPCERRVLEAAIAERQALRRCRVAGFALPGEEVFERWYVADKELSAAVRALLRERRTHREAAEMEEAEYEVRGGRRG